MTLRPFFVGSLLLAAACEGRDVEVFEVSVARGGAIAGATDTAGATDAGGADSGSGTPDSGGGGSGASSGDSAAEPVTSCSDDSDCSPGLACDIAGCGGTGMCVPWPGICDDAPEPVCGCDGVTYWNDCIRSRSHVGLAAQGPCRGGARLCEVGADCGVPEASCSHLEPPTEMCGHSRGACWLLPPTCNAFRDPRRWRECKLPDGTPPACVDACTAIASERPFVELRRGEVCY